MRKMLIPAVGMVAAAGLLAPTAIATAGTSQSVDFTVVAASGGGLAVETGGTNSSLALAAQNADAKGTLTVFSVFDTRGGTTGWNASLALSDFVNQTDNTVTIPATNATYTPGTAIGEILGGEATPPSSSIALKNAPTIVMTRANRNLGATYEHVSWTNINALTVDLPQSVALGQYRATLTLSAT